MDRVELLISRVRVETENTDFGESHGISDDECLGYLNDAQDRAYSEIIKKHPNVFVKQEIVPTVNAQEAYDLPTDIYLRKIVLLEYSSTGQEQDYYRIEQAQMAERLSYPIGHPRFYIGKNKQILLVPTPYSGGFLRISYVKALPKLDIRRGKVLSVVQSGSDVTSITLDPAAAIDRDALLAKGWMSVVDKDGELVAKEIELTDINESTGLVTMSTKTLSTGESITAGDYVVAGSYACNKSELDPIVERYLASHLRLEMLDRDSNTTGTASQNDKTAQMLNDIVDSFADMSDDNIYPTMLDSGYLLPDGWKM